MVENKNSQESSKSVKCNACELVFQTKSGLKVHNDFVHVHHTSFVSQDNLKCEHFTITFSD